MIPKVLNLRKGRTLFPPGILFPTFHTSLKESATALIRKCESGLSPPARTLRHIVQSRDTWEVQDML